MQDPEALVLGLPETAGPDFTEHITFSNSPNLPVCCKFLPVQT